MRKRAPVRACLGVLLAFLVWQTSTAAASGGQQAGTPAAGASEQGGTEPPVIRFDPEGLDLAEAVRLTLLHSPQIKLSEQAAHQESGVAQEQTGAFDTSFFGDASYNRQRQSLTSSAKLSETLKREDLRTASNDQKVVARDLQATITQLQAIQNAPAGAAQLAELKKLDPVTTANIQMIDALTTSNIGNATLQNDLKKIRQELINDSVKNAQDGAQQALTASGQLDAIVTRLGVAPELEYFFNGATNVSLSRLFRNGITFSPFFSGTDNGGNYVDKPFSADYGGKGIYPLYTFKGGFNFTLPFARGLGQDAVAAPERSSRMNAEAALLDAQQQNAASVLDTINAYWSLRAAQEGVDITLRSVDIQTKLVELTRGAIAAGVLPQVELARVQASEARSQAALRSAQSALLAARVGLATAMGVSATPDDATLPRAREAFPVVPDPALIGDPQVAALATGAMQQRRDVTAAVRRQEAARVLVRGANLNLKPRIDLSGGSWYTGLDEAVLSDALGRWVGPSYNITLNVEKPFGNNQLRGQLVQAQAGSATSQVNMVDLQRQVRLNIVRAARSLSEAIARVTQARAAVDFYQQTIDAEVERYRIGEVTLIDTITTESQQADARRTLVAAQQDVAQLIAELRFQSGTLVEDARAPVVPQSLVTVPKE